MEYFKGYIRENGEVGIRNFVLVISAMDNINPVVKRIADNVRGVRGITTWYGRGLIGEDKEQQLRTLAGLGMNPNVSSVLVVSLEPKSAEEIASRIRVSKKRVETLTIQEAGGTMEATQAGIKKAAEMVVEASRIEKEKVGIDRLTIAVECGGTDSTSGILTNPAIGYVSDKLIGYQGKVIMTEITEMIGAEHILADRAVNQQVEEQIIKAVADLENYADSLGVDLKGANPVPDNIKGGITTIEEKSIGAILKGGTGPVHGFLKYGDRPLESGLYVMDSTPPAVESMTAMAAGGAQIILFSTGQGNTICNPVAPTVKITANPETAQRMKINMDVDLSTDMVNGFELADVGERLWSFIREYASGKLTTGEVIGEEEVGISRIGLVI